MIKLVPVTSHEVVESTPEVSAASTGPSLVSRTTSYRGARRPAPVQRMWRLDIRVEAPEAEEVEDLQGETFPVIFA